MSIDTHHIQKLARLSRLDIADNQCHQYQADLAKVLDFVALLSDLNTDTVEPMAGVGDMTQRLRKDKADDGGYPDTLMQNAPQSTMNFFTVPKVVD